MTKNTEIDGTQRDFAFVNITWNNNKWKKIDQKAPSKHEDVQKGNLPHESLNFKFNKKCDGPEYIYGSSPAFRYQTTLRNDGKAVIFFVSTKHGDPKVGNKIVGVYGNVIRLEEPLTSDEPGFESEGGLNLLFMRAEKKYTLLFPEYLDLEKYGKISAIMNRSGINYRDINRDIARNILADEIEACVNPSSLSKLHSIFELIVGKPYDEKAAMPLRMIMDRSNIEKYSKKLEERLRKYGKHTDDLVADGRQTVFAKYRFPKESIWWQHREELQDKRTVHRNWFGLYDKSSSKPHEICQINFYAPSNFKNQPSAFAEDSKTGKVYVIHSGYLCWSKQKDGRTLFKESFEATKRLIQVEWRGKLQSWICVLSLDDDDDDLIHNLADFVKKADEVENKVKAIRYAEEEVELADAEKELQDEHVAESEARARLKALIPKTDKYVYVRQKLRKRDTCIMALIKHVRGYQCQICGKFIKKKSGGKYVEAAHIKPKSEGGRESPDNIMVLCPNHHKEYDIGNRENIYANKNEIKFKLNGKIHILDLRI